MDKSKFYEVLDKLVELYSLERDREHDSVVEFLDGSVPLFKLIFSEQGLILSFHIDVDAPEAIVWYLRVRDLDAEVKLTASYVMDNSGEILLGDKAHLHRRQAIEDGVLTALKIEAGKTRVGDVEVDGQDRLVQDFDLLEPKKYQRFN